MGWLLLPAVLFSTVIPAQALECQSLNVSKCEEWADPFKTTCLRWESTPWHGGSFSQLSFKGCPVLENASAFADEFATFAADMLKQYNKKTLTVQPRALVDTVGGSKGLGYLLGFLELFNAALKMNERWLRNPCTAQSLGIDEIALLDNHAQLQDLDPWNVSGQRVLSSVEACCTCGGGSHPTPMDPVVESALLDFYAQTGGPSWSVIGALASSVVSGDMLHWNTSHHYCVWHGLNCDSQGRVISMGFFANNLVGTVPPSIGNLTDLSFLALVGNPLSGTLPHTITKMSQLSVMACMGFLDFLGLPSLSGTVPPLLTPLQALVIMGDALSGTLPSSFGNNARALILFYTNVLTIAPFMRDIFVSARQGFNLRPISGTLPHILGSNGALRCLITINTKLSGSLPDFTNGNLIEVVQQQTAIVLKNALQAMGFYGYTGFLPRFAPARTPYLHTVQLEHLPRIKGCMAEDVFQLTSLAIFTLLNLGLSGTVPSDFNNKSLLHKFQISDNTVSGHVPEGLNTMSVLYEFQFHSTRISGDEAHLPWPNAFGWLGSIPPSIQMLELWIGFNNRMSGTIPDTRWQAQGNYRGKHIFYLASALLFGYQRISGTVPDMRELHDLRIFDTSESRISGDLWRKLPVSNLKMFHVSDSKLSGMLPPGFSPKLESFFVYKNRLSGTLSSDLFGMTSNSSRSSQYRRATIQYQIKYASMSKSLFSGTIPREFCSLSSIKGLNLNGLYMSGTVPSCIGGLSRLTVLALAMNYFTGTIPTEFDQLSSLETIMLSSNRFRCNAPALGQAKFGDHYTGIWYPAQQLLSKHLTETKDVAPFTLWLLSKAPDVRNSCLIFTGNNWVGTSASLLLGRDAPNSVEHDVLRKGDYGLFPGQAVPKQILWLLLPVFLGVFCATAVMMARQRRDSSSSDGVNEIGARDGLLQLARSSMGRQWGTDNRNFGRLVKHINFSAPFAITHSIVLLIFYYSLIPDEYECVLWTPDISYLSEATFPWRDSLFKKSEDIVEWIFVLIAVSLFAFVVRFWSRVSWFGRDDHFYRAQRTYASFRTISNMQKSKVSPVYQCLNQWAVKALHIESIFDFPARHQRNQQRNVLLRQLCFAAYLFLTPLCSLVLSLASLGYTLAQNVGSSDGILALCSNSTAVVIINTLIQCLLLKYIANKLVQLELSTEIEDNQLRSQKYTETLYCIGIWSKVIWPVIVTVILDESCYRYYLKFTSDLNELFTFWGSGQIGEDAYRAGTCLQNVAAIYTPVWLTQMLFGLLFEPAMTMLRNHRLYIRTEAWCRRKLGLKDSIDEEEYLIAKVEEAQNAISVMLISLDVGIGFCMWSPLLLLFHKKHTFVRNLVAFVKAPVPSDLFGTFVSVHVWLASFLVILDLGFGLGPSLLWLLSTTAIIVFAVFSQTRYKQATDAIAGSTLVPTEISFIPCQTLPPSKVAFRRTADTNTNIASATMINFRN